jgi:hypothetical protein
MIEALKDHDIIRGYGRLGGEHLETLVAPTWLKAREELFAPSAGSDGEPAHVARQDGTGTGYAGAEGEALAR